MIQCPGGHRFCKGCIITFSENKLATYTTNIDCIDQSGCKLSFGEKELKRCLYPKLFDLYMRIKQTQEIKAAGLAGLEECPFCDFMAIIEDSDELVFRCAHIECGIVSCRACKRKVCFYYFRFFQQLFLSSIVEPSSQKLRR